MAEEREQSAENSLKIGIHIGIFSSIYSELPGTFVMAKNTSISLGNHFEQFIAQEIKKGRFGSASEVIRAGLRLLEEEMRRAALEAGEKSGFVENYSLNALIQTLDQK